MKPDPDESIVAKVLAEKEKHDTGHCSDPDHVEMVMLRTKLEVRGWMLRISLMFNLGMTTGIIVALLTK